MSLRVATAKERVLRIAADLFAQRGFAGTSMQDIADALGVRKPSLYKHISSKDALYAEVLDTVLTPFSEALDDALADPADTAAISALPELMLRRLHEHPHVARLLLQGIVQLDGASDPHLTKWLNRLFTQTDVILTHAHAHIDDPAQIRIVWVAAMTMALGFTASTPLLPIAALGFEDLIEREAALLAATLNPMHVR